MPKFKVTVSRIAVAYKEIVVDVADESMAQAEALVQAANQEFPLEHHADYGVEAWTPLDEGTPPKRAMRNR